MNTAGQGPAPMYNSLKDEHLVRYFSRPVNRQHLRKAGLIRRNGEIISDSDFVEASMKKDQKLRAQTAILRSLEARRDDLERNHQALCLRTLEEIEKIERVKRVRSGVRRRSGDERYADELIECSIVPSSVCHRPLSAAAVSSTKTCLFMSSGKNGRGQRIRSAGQCHGGDCRHRNDPNHQCHEFLESYNHGSNGGTRNLSPYLLRTNAPRPPDYVLSRIHTVNSSKRSFRRKNRADKSPKTFSPYSTQEMDCDDPRMVLITMKYFGDRLILDNDHTDPRDEILIEQQHCGGNTLTVFKDKILPGTEFPFPSYRRTGYPFSLSVYVNGRYDSRLSVCCEYKHRINARLGGKGGHFAIIGVRGGRPCYRCIANGLSKKKRRRRPKSTGDDFDSTGDGANSEEDTALSVYEPRNTNKVKVPVNDDEDDDKEFKNLEGRTSEPQSPDSGRRGKSGKKQKPGSGRSREGKRDESPREKDRYNHFQYDIKVPVDDDDDDKDNGTGRVRSANPSGRRSVLYGAKNKKREDPKSSPKTRKPASESSESSDSDHSTEGDLERAKPKSSRSQRDSSDDDDSYTTGS